MVAPPARKDWPAISTEKRDLKREIKKEREGTEPSDVNHKGDARGNNESRECKYLVKWRSDGQENRSPKTKMELPSNCRSALWAGKVKP
jgi:hypothetical protein